MGELPPDAGTLRRSERWGVLGLGLLVCACWMLLHPYRGLAHDGTLYGLLALAHLHPGSLDHDLFVRLGVQNQYTIFTPLYAGAARYLGLEHAAALLTLITHLAFFSCAWLLARKFGCARSAWLGVGLLLVLPAFYGWGSVFAYTESFLTPRQPAEAFALAGLVAALARRPLLAICFMLGALLLHPLIAAAGVAVWATLVLGLPRPRIALGLVLTGTVLLVILSAAIARGPFAHFDAHWLSILQERLKYLFPSRWPPSEWGPTVVPLSVLFIGALAADRQDLRRLCLATLLTVAFGLLIAIIESDWLHVIIAGQLQLWRWLWLASVLATVLLPVIALDCWRAGGVNRAAIVIIGAAWIDTSGLFAVLVSLGACCCAMAARGMDNPRLAQLLLYGSYLGLAISFASVLVGFHEALLEHTAVRGGFYSRAVESARLLSYHGILPALILGVAFSRVGAGLRWTLPIAILGAAACAVVAPPAVARWRHVAYPPARIAAFAAWRAIIPPGTPILWPEEAPTDEWFTLERPSYWSLYQMAGMVFSRDETMIGTYLESKADPLIPAIRRDPDSQLKQERSPHGLADVCALPDLRFFASWNYLGPTAYPTVAPDSNHPSERLYLYRCAPSRTKLAADAS